MQQPRSLGPNVSATTAGTIWPTLLPRCGSKSMALSLALPFANYYLSRLLD